MRVISDALYFVHKKYRQEKAQLGAQILSTVITRKCVLNNKKGLRSFFNTNNEDLAIVVLLIYNYYNHVHFGPHFQLFIPLNSCVKYGVLATLELYELSD